MSNPFYSALGGANDNTFVNMLIQLKSNPIQFLLSKKYNVPTDISNDPNAILQYLLSSGQINQNQVNTAFQSAQKMGGLFR